MPSDANPKVKELVRNVDLGIEPVELIDPVPADLFPNDGSVDPDSEPLEDPVVDERTEPELQVRPQDLDPGVVTTRVGRVSRPPAWTKDFITYRPVANEAIQEVAGEEFERQWMSPCVYAALSDPDILYLHEAMAGADKPQFLKAMIDEVDGQTANENWIVVKRSELPANTRILPCVWAMRRKRRIMDGLIYKWKARLNVDGGKQIHGIDYWDTYAPVASWLTIRLILIMALRHKWCIKQLDFVQAYPRAPAETELYIYIPK
jgi:hypothetical protein